PAGGKGGQQVTVAAAADAGEGFATIPVKVHSATGDLPPTALNVVVAKPGSLLALFDNNGVSDDADMSTSNYDGYGYSYSAQALAAVGYMPGATVSVGGTSFTLPASKPGEPDNVSVHGQTVPLPNAAAGASKLSFL